MNGTDEFGKTRQLQNIVSLSALYSRLAAKGYKVASPRGLTRLDEGGAAIVSEWVDTSVAALRETMLSINCLIDPQAILIGGRLPASIVDELANRLNVLMRTYADKIPAIAPVARAAMSDDAPAVGAAILPFSDRLLPTRTALMKTANTP